jgi:hypothetical protein
MKSPCFDCELQKKLELLEAAGAEPIRPDDCIYCYPRLCYMAWLAEAPKPPLPADKGRARISCYGGRNNMEGGVFDTPSVDGLCKFPGCVNPGTKSGYCVRCYHLVRRRQAAGQPIYAPVTAAGRPQQERGECQFPGCDKPRVYREYCKRHYQVVKRRKKAGSFIHAPLHQTRSFADIRHPFNVSQGEI